MYPVQEDEYLSLKRTGGADRSPTLPALPNRVPSCCFANNGVKTYVVQRSTSRVNCTVIPETGSPYPLPHLVHHSPDGYEYGYEGSGPSELARCIVADLSGNSDPDPTIYHSFKRRVIAQLEGNGPHFISGAHVL